MQVRPTLIYFYVYYSRFHLKGFVNPYCYYYYWLLLLLVQLLLYCMYYCIAFCEVILKLHK